jgi:L-arabinonolactonase
MKKKTSVDLVLDAKAEFAECPVWAQDFQVLFWLDMRAPSLNRFDPATNTNQVYMLPEPAGSFARTVDDRFLVALQSGAALFEPLSGIVEPVIDPEPQYPENRLNDGRCDRQGRFWVGSMHDPASGKSPTGGLYRIEEGSSTKFADQVMTANGLAFSPDGKTMYFADSHPSVRTVWAFDFDIDDGVPTNRRIFVDTNGMPGRPDGAAIDTDGCYWSAAADGWEIVRYTPDGRVDERISLPVSQPSMPAFGGPDMRTLYITSLRWPGLDVSRQPHAGGIFAVDVGAQGIADSLFKG